MTMTRPAHLISSNDWLYIDWLTGHPKLWLMLLDNDVQSAQISMACYGEARSRLLFFDPETREAVSALMFHHARSFVSAVRRVGRLADFIVANRSMFPRDVGKDIRLAWRKKKAFFDAYIDARNAIEHVDGELSDQTKWSFVNLDNNTLIVSEGNSAEVTLAALQKVVDLRTELLGVIGAHNQTSKDSD